MKYAIVPIYATELMSKALFERAEIMIHDLTKQPVFVNTQQALNAALAAAPPTNLVAVDKGELEALKAKSMELLPISNLKNPAIGMKILAMCNHAADPYALEDGKLTDYGASAEGLSHVEDGLHVLEFCEGDSEISDFDGKHIQWPNWWFLSGSNAEIAANPVSYIDLTPFGGDNG